MSKNIKSSNKSFGIVFFIVFLIIGLYPLINQDGIRIWAIIVSLIFLVLGLINSNSLTPLNKLWIKFGILLGNIISPLVLGIIFFLVVLPTGLLMRILKKNFLGLKFDKNLKSYWINKEKKFKFNEKSVLNYELYKRILEFFKREKKILVITNNNSFSIIWWINCFNPRNCGRAIYLYNILSDYNFRYISFLS